MGNNFIKPRGTEDFIGDVAYQYEELINRLNHLARLYGASSVIVPMFEESKLFKRGVGESTDIVTKETFDLVNKGGHEYTLRPEFTAGIMRMLIENKEYASPHMPLKYFYSGSIFRYERPQAGRLREPHQWGVEYIDSSLDLVTITEAISLMVNALTDIGISKPILYINTLGSGESRQNYRKALVEYFKDHIDNMCEDCKTRLVTNPLRILDCKVESDKMIIKNAPSIIDFLTEEDKEEFEKIKNLLECLNISYRIDDRLVRGLDYYTGLVFEVYEEEHLNLGALGGGGVYSGLSKTLGGPELSGVGFSFGLDRLLLTLSEKRVKEEFDVMLYVNDDMKEILVLADNLRKNDISIIIPHVGKSLKSAMKMADAKGIKRFVFKKDSKYIVKDMTLNTQVEVDYDDIYAMLNDRRLYVKN